MAKEAIYNPATGQTTWTDLDVTYTPLTLSKTAFQDYAVSQLGGIPDGMARFITIMESTKVSASAAVRFAYARYEAATTFEKTNTAAITQVMVDGGCMTSQERTDILDNWPESAV